jgi:electron transfer flavoprotein-quinone oxidoreductase
MVYDVVVVGAGPGGSTAAWAAAKKGLKTLLLERGRMPGEKSPCCGGINPCLWQDNLELKKLIEDVLKEIPLYLSYGFHTAYVDKDNKIAFEFYYRFPDRIPFATWSMRSDFDKALSNKAVEAGAELKNSTTVVDVIRKKDKIAGVLTSHGEAISARIVIAADGTVSTVARKAGLLTRWPDSEVALGYMEFFKMSSKDIEDSFEDIGIHTFLGPTVTVSPIHASWILPRLHGVQIGVVGHIKQIDRNLKWYINNIYKINKMRKLLEKAEGFPSKPAEVEAKTLQYARYLEKMYMNGLMVVGDAAGCCDPGAMEGIHAAAISGLLAAETAAEAISKGDYSEKTLAQYQKKWEQSVIAQRFKTMGAAYVKARSGYPIDKLVENMRLAGPPMMIGSPRSGRFEDLTTWNAATKLIQWISSYSHYMQMLGPEFGEWLKKNLESLRDKGVYAHPW